MDVVQKEAGHPAIGVMAVPDEAFCPNSSNDVPTCELVLAAVGVMYGNTDVAQKQQAMRYLERFQKSVYAWKIADEILHRHMDRHSCYFAALTMRRKIQCNFNELPASAYESLRDSLLNQLTKAWHPTVSTQLAMAIADLAMLMPQWSTPLDDILNRFSPSCGTDPSTSVVLLELLSVFPEEVDSRDFRLGENRRQQVMEILRASGPRVLAILRGALQGFDAEQVHCQVFRCLGAWLSIGVLPSEDPVLVGEVLPRAFDVLQNSEASLTLHEAAREAVCQAICLAENTARHPRLIWLCANRVYGLSSTYVKAVTSEDTDKSNNLTRVFTELGESLLGDILATPGQGLGDGRTLELILLCGQHYDYEIAEITFTFWSKFSNHVYKADNDELRFFFKPYILRLLSILCQHCQLEADRDSLPQKYDDFVEFRERCSDLVKDVIFIVGSQQCFTMLRERLTEIGPQAPWNVTEATLFIMTAVARNILPDEDTIVPPVMEAALALPDNCHVAVRHTAIRLIGELSEWLGKHSKYIEGALNLVVSALKTPSAAAAAITLQQLCFHCRNALRPHGAAIVDFIVTINAQLDETGSDAICSQETIMGCLQSATHILADSGDATRLMLLLEGQLLPIDQMLTNLQHQVSGKYHPSDPALWADRAAAIFRELTCLRPPEKTGLPAKATFGALENTSVFALGQRSWRSLDGVMQRWSEDQRIMERTCRTIRYIVRALSTDASPLLEPLANRVVTTYTTYPHSCFLYLSSILVDEFGNVGPCVPGIIALVDAFVSATFRNLSTAEALESNPDTVEDLFRLCTRCVQRAPLPLMTSSCFRGIVECAFACASIAHREANSAVMRFFCELIGSPLDESAGDIGLFTMTRSTILNELGERLVYCLVTAAVLKLSTYQCHEVGEVLYELSKKVESSKFRSWLEGAARSLPTVGSGGSVTVTPDQLNLFLKSASTAEEPKEFRNALRDLARLYI